MNRKTKTLIRYIGSKARMVNEIRSIIPPSCDMLVEPFAGSAAVSINCTNINNVYLNDINEYIANFLTVVSNEKTGKQLLNELQKISIDDDAFQEARIRQKDHGSWNISNISLATETWMLKNCSFNSGGNIFSSREDIWKHNKLEELRKIIESLSRRNVKVENENALYFLEEGKFLESPNCFVYCDPPYIAGTRSKQNLYGVYDMQSITEHSELLMTIENAKAKIALSGYSSKLYDEYLLNRGWYKYSLGEFNKGCDVSKEKSKGTEIVWTNYSLGDNPPNGITECKQDNIRHLM